VPRIERSAKVEWDGNVATGAVSNLPYTLATRIGNPEGKTSPEELLAAAHAGCFTTSLAGELTKDGTPPGHLEVSCTIVMDEVPDAGHQIVGSNLTISTEVAGAEPAALAAAIERADEGCPFSTLLKKAGATVQISQA
jgi:lipoyl-dependent peroxiredoxin